jgi:hypothetical protein
MVMYCTPVALRPVPITFIELHGQPFQYYTMCADPPPFTPMFT